MQILELKVVLIYFQSNSNNYLRYNKKAKKNGFGLDSITESDSDKNIYKNVVLSFIFRWKK
jgi:hypothetical protein